MSLFLLLVLAAAGGTPETMEIVDIAPVWAAHPVGFSLHTHGEIQFAAFYDAERKMTVARRRVDTGDWRFVALPETLGWDSHNYIAMTVDDREFIHLSGNMHVTPLVYFRTSAPLDITTFERAAMVGEREERVTYPRFLRGANNELLFCYRDGRSGDGEEIYNIYDSDKGQWRRFLDTPLTSGEGERNAYLMGPVRGPDNRFHICWVWRVHSGCESNHHLCYAVSDDLRAWRTGAGEPVALPMTLDNADTVDPVPVNGGMINGNTRLGFDSLHRPVISYHKFDAQGNTQLYNARLEEGRWVIYQTSDWAYRWEFSGGGTIIFEIRLSGVSRHDEGTLRQNYTHIKYGSGTWLLDEKDFSILGEIDLPPAYPAETEQVRSAFEGMEVRRASDSGRPSERGVRYYLQWETLPQHRDRPREGELPPPSMLQLVKVKTGR